jgi:hypothetical protein
MKKIIIFLSICFISSLNIDAYAASIEQNKTEFQDFQKINTDIENQLISNPFLSKINYKITNIDQVESCTVTITVFGPLGEPYGTFTGTSWISCDMALSYAIARLLEVLSP